VTRAFISFLTDFGADGAAAICRGVMLSIAPDAQIVDISHSVRKFAIGEGAYLLWTALPWMPVGVHVAVVDPGVGTDRRPIGIRAARGDVLIGPDNGLLSAATDRLGGIVEVRLLANPGWLLPRQSATFHGRDIFAPMAAHVALGGAFAEVGPIVDAGSIVDLRFPKPVIRDGGLETAAIYVDSFGNVRLGATPEDLARALGEIAPETAVRIRFDDGGPGEPVTTTATFARTFGALPPGAALLYVDSSGQLALGHNQASAAAALGVEAGRGVRIDRA
jgi:S-adenosyl-L-methionine hydrolase (adenosine-forming)